MMAIVIQRIEVDDFIYLFIFYISFREREREKGNALENHFEEKKRVAWEGDAAVSQRRWKRKPLPLIPRNPVEKLGRKTR